VNRQAKQPGSLGNVRAFLEMRESLIPAFDDAKPGRP